MTAGDVWALHSPLLFSVHSLTRTSLQIWRLFTCVLFYGKLGFPFLTWLYFLYSYSLRLEQEHFSRRTADYIYAMLIVWVIMLVIGYVFDQMVRYMAIVAFNRSLPRARARHRLQSSYRTAHIDAASFFSHGHSFFF